MTDNSVVEFTQIPNEDKFKQNVDEIVEQCSELVVDWSNKEAGDMIHWFTVMRSIMGVIESKWGQTLTGIQKAEVATSSVVAIAHGIWDKTIEGMTPEEEQALRTGELKILCVLMDNPEILNASTSILKKILDFILIL